jgi:hypothetical protein
MPSYVAESYLPRTRRDPSSPGTQARDAAQALAGHGQDIAYLRSAFTGSGIAISCSRVIQTTLPLPSLASH